MRGVGVWAFGEGAGEGEGGEEGLGVVVLGEEEVRGMEEMVRSEARGRWVRRRGGGVSLAVVVVVFLAVGRWFGGSGFSLGLEEASSQAARAAGSTGQVDGGAVSVVGAIAAGTWVVNDGFG